MKIIHFSDTHLGFNDLDILNSENINQREADFYDTFTQVIDEIIKIDRILWFIQGICFIGLLQRIGR